MGLPLSAARYPALASLSLNHSAIPFVSTSPGTPALHFDQAFIAQSLENPSNGRLAHTRTVFRDL